ncbi:unnamed protein product [Mytilus edulis]|uniref:Uncharacterized protein n=1 Tax=Mytilus edulis TaxID=6550 RepID=A0A8S3RZD0_MYTED|nr:unnamed protein product [Mytilus edulis]
MEKEETHDIHKGNLNRKHTGISNQDLNGKHTWEIQSASRPRWKGGTHDIHKGILTENIPGKSNQLRALDGKGGTHDIHKRDLNGKHTKGSGKSNPIRALDGKGGTHDIHKGILTENIPGKSNQRRALDGKGGTHDIHKGILTENIPGKSNQLRPRWKGGTHDIHKGILTENIPGKNIRALDGKGGTNTQRDLNGKHTWEIQSATCPRWKGGTHDIHKGILTENIPGKSNQLRALDGKGGTHDIHKGILTENIPGNPISYAP